MSVHAYTCEVCKKEFRYGDGTDEVVGYARDVCGSGGSNMTGTMMQLLPILTELVNIGITVQFSPWKAQCMRVLMARGRYSIERYIHLRSFAAMTFDGMYEELSNMRDILNASTTGHDEPK